MDRLARESQVPARLSHPIRCAATSLFHLRRLQRRPRGCRLICSEVPPLLKGTMCSISRFLALPHRRQRRRRRPARLRKYCRGTGRLSELRGISV